MHSDVDWKNATTFDLFVDFGQKYEDYRDSISDNSEKVQVVLGEGVSWFLQNFSEVGYLHKFLQKPAASKKEQMSPLMILGFSRYEEMQELGS